MINSVEVKGYRGFSKFAMKGLARINLLVGKNNCGKTSLLEALSILRGGNDLSALWQTLARRGEQPVPEVVPGRAIQQEVDVGHFFTGHQASIGSEFSISATNKSPSRSIKFAITEPKPQESPQLFNILTSQEPAGAAMGLKISGTPGISVPLIPLTRRGS